MVTVTCVRPITDYSRPNHNSCSLLPTNPWQQLRGGLFSGFLLKKMPCAGDDVESGPRHLGRPAPPPLDRKDRVRVAEDEMGGLLPGLQRLETPRLIRRVAQLR